MKSKVGENVFVDQRVVATLRTLIDLYKTNFGSDWKTAFMSTVVCRIAER
jgi:hypothetical protein